MNRIFSIICAMVIVLYGAAALPCGAASDLKEISQNSPFQMTVLGDSIAAGYGLEGHDPKNEPCYQCASYANILAEKYGLTAGNSYYNDAVSGATTSDLIATLATNEVSRHIKNSDTIIISIGGNDLLQVLWNALNSADIENSGEGIEEMMSSVDPGQLLAIMSSIRENLGGALDGFESNLDVIIDKIREINPQALVIVCTIYDPFEDSELFAAIGEISGGAIDSLNEIIEDSAEDSDGNKRYTVSDVAAQFYGKAEELTNISTYDIHPNAEGHEVIAELLDKEITSHTFTTWIIDTSAQSQQYSEAEKTDAKIFARIMFGFFFMLVIMMTVLFVHSMNNLRNK